MEKKIMKKTIITSFFALILVGIMVGGVLGGIATSDVATGQTGGNERKFGDGLWKGNNQKFYKTEQECKDEECSGADSSGDGTENCPCTKASPEDVANNPKWALDKERFDDFQNAISKDQHNALVKQQIEKRTGLKVVGDEINNFELMPNGDNGELSDSFKYKGTEVKFETLKDKGYSEIDFSGDNMKLTGYLDEVRHTFEWDGKNPLETFKKNINLEIQSLQNTVTAAVKQNTGLREQLIKLLPSTGLGPRAKGLAESVGQAMGQGASQVASGLMQGIQGAQQAVQTWAQYLQKPKDDIIASRKESNAKAQQNKMKAEGGYVGGIQRGNGDTAMTFQGGAEIVNEDEAKLDAETVALVDSGAGLYVREDTYLTNAGTQTNAFPPATETPEETLEPTTPETPTEITPEIAAMQQEQISISLPLINILSKISLSLIPSVTAQVTGNQIADISGQYITFKDDDLDFNGREIEIYALKTFDEVKAGGQDLDFYSANFRVKFDQQRIYVNRLQPNAPFGANRIQNKLDPNTEFRLQPYTNRKGNFYDKDNRFTITDIITKHPKEKLIIAKIRKDMWK